jgi:hypothetical protein
MDDNMITTYVDEDFAKMRNKTMFGMARPMTSNASEKMKPIMKELSESADGKIVRRILESL